MNDGPTSAVSVGEVNVVVAESFDVFVRREQRGLVALAIGLTGNVQDSQDVVQDVLITASRRWAAVGAYESPAGWARRAVANRSTSVLRRKAAQARRFLRLVSRHETHVIDMPDESAHLWAAIRALPRRQAEVVTLKAVYGLSIQDIADTLGITKSTAQTHLRRAMEALRADSGGE